MLYNSIFILILSWHIYIKHDPSDNARQILHRAYTGPYTPVHHSFPVDDFEEVHSLICSVIGIGIVTKIWHLVQLFSTKIAASITICRNQMATICTTYRQVLELLKVVPSHNARIPETVVQVRMTWWNQSDLSTIKIIHICIQNCSDSDFLDVHQMVNQ